MGHAIHIDSQEQYIQAVRVLDKVGGTWQGIGPSSDPVLLLTDAQYDALVQAGVVSANDKEVKARGKKPTVKKTKLAAIEMDSATRTGGCSGGCTD